MTQITIPIPPSKEEIKQIVEEVLTSVLNQREVPKDYSKKKFSSLVDKSISWIDSQRRMGLLKWFLRGSEVRIPHEELLRLQNRL